MLIGSAITAGIGGAAIAALLGNEGAAFFGLSLFPVDIIIATGIMGGAVGGLISVFRNRIRYQVKGQKENWQTIKALLSKESFESMWDIMIAKTYR